MDREAMLLRIDFGEVGGVLLHEVEWGRRDDAPIILKWSVVSDVINAHPRPAARGHPAAQELFVGLYFRLGWLASRGPFRACSCACGHTSQCGRVFQEPPAARSI